MKINPTNVSIAALEKTWLDGLSIWKRITGNDEYNRVSLQTYYLAIRDGLPDKPFETPLARLRQWMAERLHDMSPIYDNPAKAISAILGFAGGKLGVASLGVNDGVRTVSRHLGQVEHFGEAQDG